MFRRFWNMFPGLYFFDFLTVFFIPFIKIYKYNANTCNSGAYGYAINNGVFGVINAVCSNRLY